MTLTISKYKGQYNVEITVIDIVVTTVEIKVVYLNGKSDN